MRGGAVPTTAEAAWGVLHDSGVLTVQELARRIGCTPQSMLRYARAWALAGEVCLDAANRSTIAALVTMISGDPTAPDVYGDAVMTYVSRDRWSVHIEGTPARPKYVTHWRRTARAEGSIQWARSFLEEPMPVHDETRLPGQWQVMRGGTRRYWWSGSLHDLQQFLEPGDAVVDREGRPAGIGDPPAVSERLAPREAEDGAGIAPAERGWIAEDEPRPNHPVTEAISGVIGHEAPRTSVEAIARIRAWRSAMASLSAIAEAEVMAACWLIRKEHPARADFVTFLRRHDPDRCISEERAWLMAETWGVAGRQRSLRDLTSRRPDEAIAFVREFVDAGREQDLRTLDANDRQVAEILSSPPRRRTARIRALIESHEQRLELTPPETPPETQPETQPPDPAAQQAESLAGCIEALREVVMRAEALAGAIAGLSGDAGPREQWGRVLALTDLGSGSLDTIAGVAAERAGG